MGPEVTVIDEISARQGAFADPRARAVRSEFFGDDGAYSCAGCGSACGPAGLGGVAILRRGGAASFYAADRPPPALPALAQTFRPYAWPDGVAVMRLPLCPACAPREQGDRDRAGRALARVRRLVRDAMAAPAPGRDGGDGGDGDGDGSNSNEDDGGEGRSAGGAGDGEPGPDFGQDGRDGGGAGAGDGALAVRAVRQAGVPLRQGPEARAVPDAGVAAGGRDAAAARAPRRGGGRAGRDRLAGAGVPVAPGDAAAAAGAGGAGGPGDREVGRAGGGRPGGGGLADGLPGDAATGRAADAGDAPAPVTPPAPDGPHPAATASSGETDEQAARAARFAAAQAEMDAGHAALLRRASALGAALDGWGEVRGEEDWRRVQGRAEADYASGRFLLERLGGARVVEPGLMATLLALRQGLGEQFAVRGPAEEMLLDQAVLAYANFLRVQGWVGDAALLVEHRFFGQAGPEATLRGRYGDGAVAGLAVEQEINRLTALLLPALDRLTRQLVRCLRAVRELRGTTVSLSVGQVGQLNIAQAQANTVASPAAALRESDEEPAG